MIGEDAGRDPRYLSPYIQDVYAGTAPNGVYYATTTPYLAANSPNDPGPAGGEGLYRAYWRWAEPDEGYGVSSTPNSKYRPAHEATAWLTTGPSSPRATTPTTTTSLLRSIPAVQHPDGGRQRPLLERNDQPGDSPCLVSLNGGEVISADQY